ncbi:MAG TPA: type II toxin-antitoxin system VapC family toxin [Jiangellaceae bacterium]|nr:type II toxin-antitoxin system VapC family toxin [Jiangellaceae bacterium]
MIVLDASAAVDLLLRRGDAEAIHQLVSAHDVHCPELLMIEVAQALRRFEHRSALSATRAGEALDDLLDLPLEVYPIAPMVRTVWSMRADISAYDATYVALAAGLDAPLVTTDRRLARTAGLRCSIASL